MAISVRVFVQANDSQDILGQLTGTVTITKPSGTASTDILVVTFTLNQPTMGSTVATPAGWTLIAPAVSGAVKTRVYAFWALGSVSALGFSVTVGSGSLNLGYLVLAFTGVDNTTPIDVAGTGDVSAGAASVTMSAITIATDQAWDCAVGTDWNEGTVTITNFTVKQNANANCDAAFCYNTTGKSIGGTGTAVFNDSATNVAQELATLRFALRPAAAAGIALDVASNSGYQAVASTYSWSHTCTGANGFLAVDVSLLSAGQSVLGVTYNGVSLAFIGARSTVTALGRVECWGLVNPATGANNIVVTLSAAIASASTAVSYTGVNVDPPTEAFNSAQATNGGAADATVTVTTISDNCWVHAALITDDGSVTANQTTRNNVTGAVGSGADEDNNAAITPAGAQVMSYTNVGAAQTWAIAAYAIRPIADTEGAFPILFDCGQEPAMMMWRNSEDLF
jgi:hypothetical protein